MKKNNHLGFIISLLFLQFIVFGCIYSPDLESFVVVEKPAPNHRFDLSLVPDNDTIRIFNYTEFTFKYNPYGLKLLQATITIDSTTQNIYSDTATISINPESYSPGIHKLQARYYSNSGTGSIADKLGAEGYMIEKNYILMIDGSSAKSSTAQYSINSDQMFELSWPECTSLNFDAYIITKGSQNVKTIKDRKCTHWVDSLYVGGDVGYSVDIRVITNNMLTHGSILLVNEDYPHLNFKEIAIDSVMVYWKRPRIKCNIHLAYGVGVSEYTKHNFVYNGDTCYVIPTPMMDEQFTVQLSTRPYFNDNVFVFEAFNQQNYTFATSINLPTSKIGYNKIRDIFFSFNSKSLSSCDMATKKIITTTTLPEYIDRLSNAVNSDKLAVYTNNTVYIYQNQNLTTPTKISVVGLSPGNLFLLTDNDYIAMRYSNKLYMIDLNNNNEISSQILYDPQNYGTYNTPAYVSTASQDGKYIFVYSDKDSRIYRFENKQFVLLKTDSRSYYSALFNPLNPTEIVFTFLDNNSLEVRSIPDFSLLRTIQLPDHFHIENFDTKTGLLLISNFSKLLIVDIHTGIVKKGPNCTREDYLMYGNNIFSSYAYCVDMSKW
jgi:hypothetical protein